MKKSRSFYKRAWKSNFFFYLVCIIFFYLKMILKLLKASKNTQKHFVENFVETFFSSSKAFENPQRILSDF